MPNRSPQELRLSVQETRRELEYSLNDLQSKLSELTDWRSQLKRNRKQATVAAAVAGFVIGGGIAATVSFLRR